MHDLIKELRAVEQRLAAAFVSSDDAPALQQAMRQVIINTEMRQLDDIVTRLEAAVAAPQPNPIDERLADLERRQQEDSGFAQRLAIDLAETDQRLDNLVTAMREVARKDSVHASVRFLAETIAINLGGPARG